MSSPQLRVVLPGLLLAIMLSALDNLIVTTALPRIVDDLGDVTLLAWVVAAYVLGTSMSTPIWGKLGDLRGRRAVFLSSIVLFLVGSVLCGVAQDMTQLICFRGLQGVGGGGLLVGSMSIIGDLVPPRERGRYQGVVAGVMTLAMIAGPLVGGLITDHLSWRWAFFVNLPLGGAALLLLATRLKLPPTRGRDSRIDWLGAGLLLVFITSVVVVTSVGGVRYPWASASMLGLMMLAAVALVAFVLVERRVAEPILPLRLFADRNFALMSALGFMLGFALFGAVNFLPLYQQLVQRQSASASGLALLPMLLVTAAVSVVVGQYMARSGRYRIYPIVGGVVMVLGTVLLATLGSDTSVLLTTVYLAVLGIGMGFLTQTTTVISQNSAAPGDLGVATSTSVLVRAIGGLIGVAVAGGVFSTRVIDELTTRVGAAEAERLAGHGSTTTVGPDSIAALPPAIQRAVVEAFAVSTATVFRWAAVAIVLVPVLAVLVKEVPLRSRPAAAAEAETSPAGPPRP